MNVLSLCDGMSCGQIALKELDIQIDNYYASEIDKNAIKVTQDNFPNTIQLGSVILHIAKKTRCLKDYMKLKYHLLCSLIFKEYLITKNALNYFLIIA